MDETSVSSIVILFFDLGAAMKMDTYDSWCIDFMRSAAQTITPVDVMFELTSRCNLNCKMCYVHNQKNQDVLPKELSTEQWIQIFDEAIDNGMLFATLTGGECLLRSDFKELFLHLFNRGIHITVMSNSLMMNEDYTNFFAQHPPKTIQVTVYGSNNENYEKVTGVRAFDIVKRNLLALNKLTNTRIKISVTPSRYMTDDYIQILKFCKDNDLQVVNGDLFLFDNRDHKEKNDYKLTVQEIVTLEKQRHTLNKPLTPIDDLPQPGGNCSDPIMGTCCSAGRCHAFISWEGNMSPCVNLLLCKEAVLTDGYLTAWKKTAETSEKFLQPVECNGCVYAKVCFHCPAIRLSLDNEGHCNPFTCELTVSKSEVGIFSNL